MCNNSKPNKTVTKTYWSCRLCTFLNKPTNELCQICFTPKFISNSNLQEETKISTTLQSSAMESYKNNLNNNKTNTNTKNETTNDIKENKNEFEDITKPPNASNSQEEAQKNIKQINEPNTKINNNKTEVENKNKNEFDYNFDDDDDADEFSQKDDEEEEWDDIELNYDEQEKISLYKTKSQLLERELERESEKKRIEQFWKCKNCNFLNDPTRLICMSCPQVRLLHIFFVCCCYSTINCILT